MSHFRVALLALAAGALAGALVLGVGGRLLMAGLVLFAKGQPSVTPGGSLKVVSVGTGYGAAGGLLLLLLRWVGAGWRRPAGALLGLLLLAVAWLTTRCWATKMGVAWGPGAAGAGEIDRPR